MKNNLTVSVMVALLTLLGMTNCTKVKDTTGANLIREEKQQTIQNYRDEIVGSWQCVEKSYNCDYAQEIVQILWEKVNSEEKREFKKDGVYNCYLKNQLACQGSYKIEDDGALVMHGNCPNLSEKIVGLTSTLLTVNQNSTYYKYHKME